MKNILGNTNDLELFNKEGKRVYEFKIYSDGYSYEYTYDENGKELTYKNSTGYSYDNQLTYKNSEGYYRIKDKYVTKEEYDAFIQSLDNPKDNKTAVEKLMIDSFGKDFRIKVNDYQLNAFQEAFEKEKQQTKDYGKWLLNNCVHIGNNLYSIEGDKSHKAYTYDELFEYYINL